MRSAARIVLAFVVLFAGAIVLPRPAGQLFAPDAFGQVPTPLISELLGEPSPSPTDDGGGDDGGSDDDGSGGGGTGGGDGGDGTGGSGGDGDGSKGGDGGGSKDGSGGSKKGSGSGSGKGNGSGKGTGGKNRKGSDPAPGGGAFVGDYQPSGSFSTDKLVSTAARLRSLGMSGEEATAKVYPPFIIGGESAWSNTWGAPRYGPGPIVRTHEGQDVFCRRDDPILAPEAGTVSYSNGGLGGVVARVHTDSSSYFYFAHLSANNAKIFPPGATVAAGDVIGFCGNSGNAITTPTHVHFGWYVNGESQNPHSSLVRWLRTAERRVVEVVAKTSNKRVKNIDRLTAARFFGDWAVPNAGELSVSGESLWASGSYPATGAFGLAEAALQAALSRGYEDEGGALGSSDDAEAPAGLEPDSELAKLLSAEGDSGD